MQCWHSAFVYCTHTHTHTPYSEVSKREESLTDGKKVTRYCNAGIEHTLTDRHPSTLYFMMLDFSKFTSSWTWLNRSCKYLTEGEKKL
jgi:hypothetical protein